MSYESNENSDNQQRVRAVLSVRRGHTRVLGAQRRTALSALIWSWRSLTEFCTISRMPAITCSLSRYCCCRVPAGACAFTGARGARDADAARAARAFGPADALVAATPTPLGAGGFSRFGAGARAGGADADAEVLAMGAVVVGR